jgi:hypothetical protein
MFPVPSHRTLGHQLDLAAVTELRAPGLLQARDDLGPVVQVTGQSGRLGVIGIANCEQAANQLLLHLARAGRQGRFPAGFVIGVQDLCGARGQHEQGGCRLRRRHDRRLFELRLGLDGHLHRRRNLRILHRRRNNGRSSAARRCRFDAG